MKIDGECSTSSHLIIINIKMLLLSLSLVDKYEIMTL